MTLGKNIRIARRFLRSIRIDTDLGDPKALEGFICPETSAEVLRSMAKHVEQTGQGAFTWTGPYGSGKSSLIVALSALLSGGGELRKNAAKVFKKRLSNAIWKALPVGNQGWNVIPVVGRRESPVQVIGEAFKQAGLVTRVPKSETRLMEVITEYVKSRPKNSGGLVIFIDEMGKFLEGAAHDSSDIYVFQQLAEIASRSQGRLLVIGVLHQAFAEYGNRLSLEIRDEWSKVQGRFIDLPVNASGEEQIELIGRAIETSRKVEEAGSLAETIASSIQRGIATSSKNLASLFESCWPLHPVVAALLGPISRRRFGQNQRSIFGFLSSAEPCGFQDFINQQTEGALYQPFQLWDYLRANLEGAILASPDGHRWSLAVEALERCEANNDDALQTNVLKTIAVIDLFKERSGLVASHEILTTCFTKREATTALNSLKKQSLITFKKFRNAYAVYAGSDFNIDEALKSALESVRDIDLVELKELADLHPILAKRHYHETGTMRWFEVDLCPLRDVAECVSNYQVQNGAIGKFLLAIPSHGENEKTAKQLYAKAVKGSERANVIVGTPPHSGEIVSLARELLALCGIRQDEPELAGDEVARRELEARIIDTKSQLEIELKRAFDHALWYQINKKPKHYQHAELNGLASSIADELFGQSPQLHNELLNHQKPSGSARSAQKALLHRMVLNEGEERLGIKGYPAEGGLFDSLLEATELYRRNSKNKWGLQAPSKNDPCNIAPVWNETLEHIKSNQNQIIKVSDLYDIWRKPPFGIKDGLMPLLAIAFIMAEQDKLAIYRDEVFRAKFDDVDVDYLAKDASSIQLRWVNLSTTAERILSGMADIVRDLHTSNQLVDLEPIAVARGLIGIYEQLPAWTKRTMRLPENARKIRDLFKRAHDPNKFLFDDIPALMQASNTRASGKKDDPKPIINAIRGGLGELVQAYPAMMQKLRDNMLTELQVMNTTPQALTLLRERAENIRDISGDFRLDAFIGRLSQFNDSKERFESIASLAANKPPQDWTDPDLDKVAINLADLSQQFVKIETFAHVKGRKNKRQSIAVIIGGEGRSTPLRQDFDVATSDDPTIKRAMKSVLDALDESDVHEHNQILAALAKIIAERIENPEKVKQKTKKKKDS